MSGNKSCDSLKCVHSSSGTMSKRNISITSFAHESGAFSSRCDIVSEKKVRSSPFPLADCPYDVMSCVVQFLDEPLDFEALRCTNTHFASTMRDPRFLDKRRQKQLARLGVGMLSSSGICDRSGNETSWVTCRTTLLASQIRSSRKWSRICRCLVWYAIYLP